MPEPTDMEDVARRAKIEREVREEIETDRARVEEEMGVRDRAFRALALLVALAVIVGVPAIGALAGLSVRLYCLASGR
jgi:hypothetical protein